ncbi:organic cation transporter protein-like [Diabrotica virgifera virgifera]|uniref:Major facilitator superfamily (MFS) profile domain-containing protein n=1 Tax=Diabrotica virgifera virgifera TaxID=50390 RepID=A0ABM5JQM6_DIAVI|nr:organic cation transporter protein-like [Diabrotica virgifera virgifera]XP_050500242.1 organic cation transporter protein-like [Diabrotica virgifera virgifera]XP_050500243.1 organic cation transporter protein-like [Diabrotica virgifera virgifera]
MSYDDVISLLGEFGRYQKKIYFLLCLPAILCAFHKLGNVFLVAEPNYRCKLPNETDNSSYHLNETTLSLYYPRDTLHKKYSSCEIYDTNNKTKPCESYIFDHEIYGYTSVIEYGLTCNSAYLIATSNALFMVGVMLGSILFGEMSDRYGRKLTFFVSLVLQLVAGLLASVAPELWTFTFLRLIIGATTSGVFLVAYVIGLEMVGPSKRPIAGTVCQMFFSLGYMLTAAFAYYIDNWRWLQFALTIPGVLFLGYWWFIPESARWLLTKNRTEEAKKLIQEAAKYNKVEISDETLNELLVTSQDTNNSNKGTKTSVLDVFKYPNMRKKSLIIFFDWFANNLTYYGLSWNTNNLGGDPYLNFVISGAVEIPGYSLLLIFLNKWGRRNLMCSCMMITGACLLLTMLVPAGHQWLLITLAMIGKLTITASYGAVYILSTEQFPTVIRNAGLGAGSTFARFGSILAPYMNALSHVWLPLPLLVFGTCAFIGGLMSLVLPETLNKKLPETMEEGEQFGKKKKKIPDESLSEKFHSIDLDEVPPKPNISENGADEKLIKNGVS